MKRLTAWLVGSLSALAFVALAFVNLEGQGAYYDELHQVPAAFFYTGQTPTMFVFEGPLGVPVLNMSYSGAIKSNIYGSYLRLSHSGFTLRSWRWLGILFTAAGLVFFVIIARPGITTVAALVFAALFLTDGSVLLMTRHDWGPVALSLALRLVFLGLWIRLAVGNGHPVLYLVAASVIGITIFEKLSAVTLMAPFVLLLVGAFKGVRTAPRLAIGGLLLGLLPLAVVNAAYYAKHGHLVSLAGVTLFRPAPAATDVLAFAREYASLATGQGAQWLILGDVVAGRPNIEMALVLVALTCVVTARMMRPSPQLVLAVRLLAAYIGVGVLLLCLPQETSAHHWILGTPFQYAAIAVAIGTITTSFPRLRLVLVAVLVALVVSRIPTVAGIRRELAAGHASAAYGQAFTQLGRLAARDADTAAFLSADWGTATQVYSFGNGARDLSYEPYWHADPGAEARRIAATTRKNTLYTLLTGLAPRFADEASQVIAAMSTAPGWTETQPAPEFQRLGSIQVRKFVRSAAK